MEKIKELAKNKFVLILVAIASYFIVKEVREFFQMKQGFQNGASEVSKKFDEVASNTKEGESVIANVKKEFTEIANNDMSKKSEKEKVFSAANYVWGAYIFNVRGRYDFCKNYGVDIRDFVNAYKSKNYVIMQNVDLIFKKEFQEKNLKFDENVLYSELKETQSKMIKQDMLEVAKSWNTTDMKLVCENFNLNANKIVEIIALDKTMPQFTGIVSSGLEKIK